MKTEYISGLPVDNLTEETLRQDLPVYITSGRKMMALCQMMLVKRNLRIIWTEQKEENLFLFCLFG